MFIFSILIHIHTYPIPCEIHAKLKKNVLSWTKSIKSINQKTECPEYVP